MKSLSQRHVGLLHVTAISKQSKLDTAISMQDKPGDRCVVQVEAQPGFRWELESSADKVANDVPMAYDHRVGVFFLLGICSVDE